MPIKQIFILITILFSTSTIHKVKAKEETRYYTNKGFRIYYDNYQVKGTGLFELNGNKIKTSGLTILWSNNIQISSNKIIIELNKENKIKTITLLQSEENKYKPLIIMFTKQRFPNHFSANKIIISFNTETNEIEKISMEENVESFYFIISKGKPKYITKSKFKKLEPFYDKERKTWNVDINYSKGEIVSIEHAYENWDTFVLKNFRIYKNDIIGEKQNLSKLKEKYIAKMNKMNA